MTDSELLAALRRIISEELDRRGMPAGTDETGRATGRRREWRDRNYPTDSFASRTASEADSDTEFTSSAEAAEWLADMARPKKPKPSGTR